MFRLTWVPPILDEANSTSTGSIHRAQELCAVLGIKFRLTTARKFYYRGWGDNSLNEKPILCSWVLTLQDLSGKPMYFCFDFFDDWSPLNIGLDIQTNSSPDFTSPKPYISFKLGSGWHTFPIYVRGSDTLYRRAHIDVIRLRPLSRGLLVTALGTSSRILTIMKRVYRYSHAPLQDIIALLSMSGHGHTDLENIWQEIDQNYPICARSGPPLPSKKVWYTHMSEALNVEDQTDFMFALIRGTRYCILHIADVGTAY